MRATCLILALVLSPGAIARAAAGEEGAARVERFTPQGTVKQVRQATARLPIFTGAGNACSAIIR